MPRLQIPELFRGRRRNPDQPRGLASRECPVANWADAVDDPRARVRLLAWLRREAASDERELAAYPADDGDA